MFQHLKHLKPTVVLFCRHHTKSCLCEAASKQTVGFAWWQNLTPSHAYLPFYVLPKCQRFKWTNSQTLTHKLRAKKSKLADWDSDSPGNILFCRAPYSNEKNFWCRESTLCKCYPGKMRQWLMTTHFCNKYLCKCMKSFQKLNFVLCHSWKKDLVYMICPLKATKLPPCKLTLAIAS